MDCSGIPAKEMNGSAEAGEYDDYTPKWEKITFDSGETEIKVPTTLIHDNYGAQTANKG